MEGVRFEDIPLEKRICLTFDLDHTLSLEEMQRPMFEDNFEAIRNAYDNKPWPDYAMRFNFGEDKSKWPPAERPKYVIEKPRDWFNLTNFAPPYNTIGYLDQFLHDNRTGVFPHYTREDLKAIGARVAMAPGLPEFFQNLRDKWSGDVRLSFNLISTGMRDIIDGMPIAKEFDNIFACELFSRSGGVIDSMSDTIQAFSKTRYLIRLAKGSEALIDNVVARGDMAFLYENMFCFGDGLSDVSHFAYARRKGSNIICVYPEGNAQAYEKSCGNSSLMARVSLLAPRDYRKGQPIWNSVNHAIERMLGQRCDMKRTALDDYRKNKMKPAELRNFSRHIEGCADCTEDVRTISVPPGKNLVVQNGRLAVV